MDEEKLTVTEYLEEMKKIEKKLIELGEKRWQLLEAAKQAEGEEKTKLLSQAKMVEDEMRLLDQRETDLKLAYDINCREKV